MTCGDQLLAAKLRTSDRDGADGSTELLAYLVQRIRKRWSEVKIIVRADSGFARDGFFDWCETHDVHYVVGLAKNQRLLKKLGKELEEARALHAQSGQAERVFTHFIYRTQKVGRAPDASSQKPNTWTKTPTLVSS